MDRNFLSSYYSAPRRICGAVCGPVTLRHTLELETVESPFVAGATTPTVSQLLVAVRILSNTPLRLAPTLRELWWSFLLRTSAAIFLCELGKLVSLFNECCARPEIKSRAGAQMEAFPPPWQADVVAGLMHLGHVSPREAWDMPVGLATWYYVLLMRQAGSDIKIETTDELDFVRETLAAMDAKGVGNG